MVYGWCDKTSQAEFESERARLQSQTQTLWHEMVMAQLNAVRPFGSMPVEEAPEMEECVKKPKSPFEYHVELWNAVNEEIAQVEEFLRKASTKKKTGRFFRVSCFTKNRKGFAVETDYQMELPLGLQEKMIRAAEEYLEELKKQRKDMEQGYE